MVPLPLSEEESSQIEKILGRRHPENHAHRVYLEVEAPAAPPASPTKAPSLPVLAGLSLPASPSTVAAAGVCVCDSGNLLTVSPIRRAFSLREKGLTLPNLDVHTHEHVEKHMPSLTVCLIRFGGFAFADEGSNEMEYIVKWKNKSYMHCAWATESILLSVCDCAACIWVTQWLASCRSDLAGRLGKRLSFLCTLDD